GAEDGIRQHARCFQFQLCGLESTLLAVDVHSRNLRRLLMFLDQNIQANHSLKFEVWSFRAALPLRWWPDRLGRRGPGERWELPLLRTAAPALRCCSSSPHTGAALPTIC